jgi:hypothetical protein
VSSRFVSMIATVYFFAIADVSPCLRGKSANALAASLTMTAITGSMFRYANRVRTFSNADVTGLQLSHHLA